jgi:hypothetical protein
MSIHKRFSRFVERYPAGPQTARQRRSMMKLLADLQSNRASYRTVRKRVGIRGPQPPVHPE